MYMYTYGIDCGDGFEWAKQRFAMRIQNEIKEWVRGARVYCKVRSDDSLLVSISRDDVSVNLTYPDASDMIKDNASTKKIAIEALSKYRKEVLGRFFRSQEEVDKMRKTS